MNEGLQVQNGVGDRFRTDDLVLGKHVLYQTELPPLSNPVDRILLIIRRARRQWGILRSD
jgi:hypothetical protein